MESKRNEKSQSKVRDEKYPLGIELDLLDNEFKNGSLNSLLIKLDKILLNKKHRETLEKNPELNQQFYQLYSAALESIVSGVTSECRKLWVNVPRNEFLQLGRELTPEKALEKRPGIVAYSKGSGLGEKVIKDILGRETYAERILAIERWIAVMNRCLEENNFQSVFIILNALRSSYVPDVPGREYEILNLWDRKNVLSPNAMSVISKMDQIQLKNYAKFRERLDNLDKLKVAYLPYIGLSMKDQTFMTETEQSCLHLDKLCNSQDYNKLVSANMYANDQLSLSSTTNVKELSEDKHEDAQLKDALEFLNKTSFASKTPQKRYEHAMDMTSAELLGIYKTDDLTHNLSQIYFKDQDYCMVMKDFHTKNESEKISYLDSCIETYKIKNPLRDALKHCRNIMEAKLKVQYLFEQLNCLKSYDEKLAFLQAQIPEFQMLQKTNKAIDKKCLAALGELCYLLQAIVTPEVDTPTTPRKMSIKSLKSFVSPPTSPLRKRVSKVQSLVPTVDITQKVEPLIPPFNTSQEGGSNLRQKELLRAATTHHLPSATSSPGPEKQLTYAKTLRRIHQTYVTKHDLQVAINKEKFELTTKNEKLQTTQNQNSEAFKRLSADDFAAESLKKSQRKKRSLIINNLFQTDDDLQKSNTKVKRRNSIDKQNLKK